MATRRPFSIQELAARSRPTGYDSSKSLKDLLRIATAERDAGEQAKAAGNIEAAFIHFAKASTLMLEDLPTHPKYTELTHSQKDAVILHGTDILDSLGSIKPLVSQRFSEWHTRHPDADLSAPAPTPTPQPQRQQSARRPAHDDRRARQEEERRARADEDRRRQQEEQHNRARRARQEQEAQRLVAEQERRQRAVAQRKDSAVYDRVANITAQTRQDQIQRERQQERDRAERERQEKERMEREELMAEKTRAQEAAMKAAAAAAYLGYPTPASLHTRVRPESYEGQALTPTQAQQPVQPPAPPPSAPPVSIPQAHHYSSAGAEHFQRSTSAAGAPPVQRTGSAARMHPPTTGPTPERPSRVPSRTGSRAEHHPPAPARPGSRADHRPTIRTDVYGTRGESDNRPNAIRTDVYGLRHESAPVGSGGPRPGSNNNLRRPSMTSPVKERPPPSVLSHPPTTGPRSHPPTTQAPVPRRRTSSQANAPQGLFPQPSFSDIRAQAQPQPTFSEARTSGGYPDPRGGPQEPRANGVFPDRPAVVQPQDILPLESPSHTWREPEEVQVHAPAPRRSGSRAGHHPVRGSSYPPPVTTTSPPPGPVSYPNLMTNHQREQGYLPSSQSMFSFAGFAQALAAERDAQVFGPIKTTMNTPPSLLFQPNPDPTPPGGRPAPLPNPYGASPPKQAYAGPGMNTGGVPTYPSMPQPQTAGYRPPGASAGPAAGPSNYATRPPPVPPQKDHMRAPPPIPPEEMHHVVQPLGQAPTAIYDSPQGSGLNHDEPDDGKLRQVLLPEEVIQKFMSIAKPNTLQNRETCGLLLGKRRTGGFAVTTLLIPRQRATSDTCEMVEEELILDFQETRGLITLGWIHTHPTQSCFMSSLDLHTHSGFQASLKEAFAIVCAPSQSPNVGIFRLTDPPGLQVISKCTIKESFHPHTAGNIYTDADQGHVKMMKKLDLSIVDLRRHSQ